MSNDGLQADPSVLQAEGRNFVKLSKDFARAVKTLENGLKAAGEYEGRPPWGADDLGDNFGALYTGFRDGMFESMAHLTGRIDDIGNGLKGMGTNHEINEDFNDSLLKAEQSRAESLGIGKMPRISSRAI
ncbi:hypothetical protein [Streptomyces alkaliterrae]|uniref:WXG100 family type VII secretion target n=1 Tax=Streptomyces alkaliterrae TaxID=2213162 RepID=A0A5P0YW24_9ACTN|nr:hypothetical protein [Streptomyces alkaliterrae]MBB1255928.1 hypothetical protein [Streptomyces alkaliterrae]MBB1261902.1 hypothetical protein [Streptomyces alkaliterrae]MQS04494.1 hypothetical protein [Streptomyces alkaliterrae]